MRKRHGYFLGFLTCVALSGIPGTAVAQPQQSTLSDDYREGGHDNLQVEFHPIDKEARKKIDDKPPAPIPRSTQAPARPTFAPRHAADETIVLPPDWEGFVDKVITDEPIPPVEAARPVIPLSHIDVPHYDDKTIQEIVGYAYSQIGTPYVWGGTVSNIGLDCSGLTQNAYAAAGIHIPRVTYDQINSGPHIPIADVQPGDLVFYNNTEHVALAIGNGQVIHAPEPGDVVKIDSITMMPIQTVVRPSR